MKIAIASDLHLNAKEAFLTALEPVDVLILAGDCFLMCPSDKLRAEQNRVLRYFKEQAECIIFVPGNHEYYGMDYREAAIEIEKFAELHDLILLQNDFCVINGQKFVGGTLWTDFNGLQPAAIRDAKAFMSDFNGAITINRRLLTPEDTVSFFDVTSSYITQVADKNTVVITHHTPSMISCHEKWLVAGASNFSFHNQLDELIEMKEMKLWIHGHTHDPCDYMLHKTRVICNPRGYTKERPEGFVFKYVEL